MPIGVFTSVGAGLGASLDAVKEMGVDNVQLQVPPAEYRNAARAREILAQFQDAGIEITLVFCGFEGESYETIPVVRETVGLVPPATRDARVRETWQIADFAAEVGAAGIGVHVGFISEDRQSEEFARIVQVIKGICEYCGSLGIGLHLETGQESADTLLHVIEKVGRDNLAVNFDPANMILYGSGQPLEALRKVGRYVRSCHCKDAVWSSEPGKTWGEEVPLGQGDVGMEEFLRILAELGYDGPLTIEREIKGEQQAKDIKEGIELLRSLKRKLGIS